LSNEQQRETKLLRRMNSNVEIELLQKNSHDSDSPHSFIFSVHSLSLSKIYGCRDSSRVSIFFAIVISDNYRIRGLAIDSVLTVGGFFLIGTNPAYSW
jgi:hypothetical protein